MKRIEETLYSVESRLVNASKICPENYQLNFDWEEYNKYINLVKKEIIKHNNYTLKSIQDLKDMINEKDAIILSNEHHEIMKYIDKHLLNDKIDYTNEEEK